MSQFPAPVSGPTAAPGDGQAAQAAVPHPVEPVGESGVVRAASWAVGLLLGVVFGMLGTVVNQASISFFGLFDAPIGLVLAIAAVTLLLVGLRLVLPSRLIAFLAALGLVGIVAVLTLPSPGGSVLVPANTAGYVWTFAPTVIALVVIAWPKLGRRRV
ncbi:hypothetical protein [Subtercola boreus]|uniref:Histidinol dehydrogenase n=1 Tax=Subtercola boreus TaxID=120213 RepID=A0A3E0WAW2_9MICO|nr:hypothetical protein [Subtercola boreus]RFA19986.1 hypothetical protein B7R24_10370 [Subtercola boreus]RFA20115.1 hypothetical protein B7R23_10310 [Subtercola boreus]RFA26442.1 hypothetical protein B7R25_10435 [Subtercola boreus]